MRNVGLAPPLILIRIASIAGIRKHKSQRIFVVANANLENIPLKVKYTADKDAYPLVRSLKETRKVMSRAVTLQVIVYTADVSSRFFFSKKGN